jgi:hypothetical protein
MPLLSQLSISLAAKETNRAMEQFGFAFDDGRWIYDFFGNHI